VLDELTARGPGVPLSASNDPNVAVSLDNRGALIVSVPSSKAQGGKYFLNRDIREAANNDFIKRGGVMRLEVPRYGEKAKVLDALMAVGAKFEKLPEDGETKHAGSEPVRPSPSARYRPISRRSSETRLTLQA
jgi:hypothetical protein